MGEDLKYVSHLKLEMEQIDIFCGIKLMSTEVCFFGVLWNLFPIKNIFPKTKWQFQKTQKKNPQFHVWETTFFEDSQGSAHLSRLNKQLLAV